jgi:hypothetical protein
MKGNGVLPSRWFWQAEIEQGITTKNCPVFSGKERINMTLT